jgi:ribosomal protein S10
MENKKDELVLVSKESLDALSDNIASISKQMKVIMNSNVKLPTIVKLISLDTRLSQRDIYKTIHALANFEKEHLK